jgi:hypothetical protein
MEACDEQAAAVADLQGADADTEAEHAAETACLHHKAGICQVGFHFKVFETVSLLQIMQQPLQSKITFRPSWQQQLQLRQNACRRGF